MELNDFPLPGYSGYKITDDGHIWSVKSERKLRGINDKNVWKVKLNGKLFSVFSIIYMQATNEERMRHVIPIDGDIYNSKISNLRPYDDQSELDIAQAKLSKSKTQLDYWQKRYDREYRDVEQLKGNNNND